MTIRVHLSRGALPRAVLLTLIVALVPLPVMGADSAKAPPAKRSSLRDAASTIAPRHLAAAEPTRHAARRSDQGSNPATQSASFFKTPAGIAVLAVLGVGVGYALYSAQHDRVSSPGKK